MPTIDRVQNNAVANLRKELLSLRPFDRHKRFVHSLVDHYSNKNNNGTLVTIKTDEEILQENYRFIRSEEDDASDTWEVRLAKKYYSRLYKEYCIVDLSRYKEGKIGLRWRTQKEVVSGKGQFTCGAKNCDVRHRVGLGLSALTSYEIPFGYDEAGERKLALVKVRLCEKHGEQLNYKSQHKKKEKRAVTKDTKVTRSRDDMMVMHARREPSLEEEAHKHRRRGTKRKLPSSSHTDDNDNVDNDEYYDNEGDEHNSEDGKDDDKVTGNTSPLVFSGLFE